MPNVLNIPESNAKVARFVPFALEGLCLFECFRRLGYPSEEIFFAPSYAKDESGAPTIALVVKHGGREFVASFAPRFDDCDDTFYVKAWEQAAQLFNTAPPDVMRAFDTVFKGYLAQGRSAALALALTTKGMYPL